MSWRERLAERIAGHPITAAARAVQADVYPHQSTMGIGADWAPTAYGEYYATSIPIYSAIKVRADAISQVPWIIHTAQASGETTPVRPAHPAQQLMDRPSPEFSGAELRRAIETNLCLWGRAFLSIELSEDGQRVELWSLRPDRMVVLPGLGRRGPYIRGYLYRGTTGDVAYLPEEVEMFRFYNPLQDRTGMSPIAPLRLSADMGKDALTYNRNTLRNNAIPDFLMLADQELTETQVEDFYNRWEARFQGPGKSGRPAIASSIRDVKPLAFSHRELEWLETLKLTVKDASRIYSVPEVMLSELEFATLANMEALVRLFWQSTILAETTMFSERITSSLLPKLGFPGLELHFDFSRIDALNEGRGHRIKRETELLDRGALTINEVRKGYDQPPVPWGDEPHFKAAGPEAPEPEQPDPEPRRRREAASASNGHQKVPSPFTGEG